MFQVSKHGLGTKHASRTIFKTRFRTQTVFLDQNLIGNSNTIAKNQISYVFFKNVCKKSLCANNNIKTKSGTHYVTKGLQLGQNQRFPIYKLPRTIFVASCTEGIFDFSDIVAKTYPPSPPEPKPDKPLRN